MNLGCPACGGQCGFADRYCRACGTALHTAADERSSPTIGASHILQSVPHSVIVTAPDGTITYWNRGAEALFGWSAREVLGQNVLTVTPSEAVVESAAEIMAQLQAGATWSGEFALRRRNGTLFSAWVTDAPITGPDGTLLGIVGLTLDLPDRGRKPLDWQDTTHYLRALVPNRPAPPVPDREAMWPDLAEPLTTRELQVLGLLARHYSNTEIATTLCISWQTVTKHTNDVYSKLQVAGRREAVERAVARGILLVRVLTDDGG